MFLKSLDLYILSVFSVLAGERINPVLGSYFVQKQEIKRLFNIVRDKISRQKAFLLHTEISRLSSEQALVCSR